MKNRFKLLVMRSLGLVLGFAGLTNAAQAQDLLGTWQLTYPNYCTENISFYSNNTYDSHSRFEIITGTFEVVESPGTDRFALTFNVERDNGRKDCSEEVNDNSGDVNRIFAEFATDTQLDLFVTEIDEEPLLSLEKL